MVVLYIREHLDCLLIFVMCGHAGTAQSPVVPSLVAAVRHVLRHGGLLAALPLDAAALHSLTLRDADAEAAAAEEAALEWQRLLPVLGLAPGAPLASLGPSFFQACCFPSHLPMCVLALQRPLPSFCVKIL